MKEYILLVPNKTKDKIIQKVRAENPKANIKLLSLEEFKRRVTFTYDEKAVFHVMQKYQIKRSTALTYLENIYYISDKLNNPKMDTLKEIKKDLEENNLIEYNPLFIQSLNNKEIIIYGYPYLTKYQKKVLEIYNYREIKPKTQNHKIEKIYHANSIEDEVIFVGNKICTLLKNNIPIENIKLIISSEYPKVVDRIFKFLNIPITISSSSIYSSSTVKKVLNNLDNLPVVLKEIENSPLCDKIINILNKYTFLDNLESGRELIENDLKKTTILKGSNTNVVSPYDYITDDDYVFFLGFNKENIPLIKKDDDYFSDKEKKILGLDTSEELNILEKETLITSLTNIKNLTLSYKSYTSNMKYTKSDLLDVPIQEIVQTDYSHSNMLNLALLTEKLDNLIKYNIKDSSLELLYNNYKDLPYLKFDNKYKGIRKSDLYSYLDNKLTLAYSSLNNYNRCKFRYYLANILKLNVIKNDFSKIIGDVCHYVLSNIDNKDFTIEKYFKKYLESERDFTSREKFFLKFVIETIKKQYSLTTFDKKLYEEKIYVNYDKNIKVTFMGIIDKLLYKEEDNITYLAVIDYKTGTQDIKLDNIKYGIDMQLPIYLYLSSNSKLKNIEVVGFYLQKLLTTNLDSKKDYEKAKEETLLLEGYSVDNQSILSKFDKTFEDSQLIKGLKTTKEGNFNKRSKVLTKEEIHDIICGTDEIIQKSIDDILDADFQINPKVINGKNVSCAYCEYKDICFRKEEDINYINEERKEVGKYAREGSEMPNI